MSREIFVAIHTERRAHLRREITSALPAPGTPFVFEIGCGNGHFLAAYAAEHPDQACLGLDLRLERIQKAVRKRDRARLTNLHFLRGDAHDFLSELPAEHRLIDTYILFPDPWPKKRHHKNRLLQAEFLTTLAARAGQGSRLFFRTDYHPYYAEVKALLAVHPSWQILSDGAFPFEHETIFQSRVSIFYSLSATLASAAGPSSEP